MRIEPPVLVAVISDTHGTLTPATCRHLKGVDLIIHAGDVGSPAIIMQLETIAPVVAVRGNTDRAGWTDELPLLESVAVGEHLISVAHDPGAPSPAEADIVVRGHTHRPLVEERGGQLHVDPGSVSWPRGSGAVPTLALLRISDTSVDAHIVEIG